MTPLTVTSVASAAIISGDLIIGLSDGSIINCGRVQGPQGLDGPAGPIGAPGRPGQDGNTILTSEGFPRPDVGTNGDYIIDKVSWTIYGPKANGVWGIGTPLRGNGGTATAQKRDLADGVPTSGDGSSGGGRAYNTSNLPLSGLGRTKADRKIDAPGGNIIPEGNDLKFQANLNRWIVNSFVALDEALPVSVGDVLPDEGEYEGDLFLKDGLLHIYTKGEWITVGGETGPPVYVGEAEPPGTPQTGELWYCTDEKYLTLFIYTGTTWAAAAPPVSLDGIESSITGIEGDLIELHNNVRDVRVDIVRTNQDLQHLVEDQKRQDDELKVLEGEIEQLAPSFERGAWNYDDGDGVVQGTEYVLSGVQTQESFDAAKLPLTNELNQCLADAGADSSARSQCNRDYDKAVGELPKVGEVIKSNQWELANKITFSYMDLDGTGHTFEDVKPGQLLDMVCEDGSGFMVAEIKKITLGMWYEEKVLEIKPINFKGVAHGRTAVKIFSIDDTVGPEELTDFVRKSGDKMTGTLEVLRDGTQGYGLKIGKKDNGNPMLGLHTDGRVDCWATTFADQHLVTKQYVNNLIAEAINNIQTPAVEPPGPARLCWEYRKPLSGKAPSAGCFWLDSDHFRFSYKTHNNINLGKYTPDVRNEWGAPGAADNKGAFEMTVWKKYDDGWYMYDHIECSDTRWSIENEGIKHFQFKKAWRSHKQSYSTGAIYYFTVGGFF